METGVPEKHFLTLFELNTRIKAVLQAGLPASCWVAAEIAEAKCNQKGHCYLDLVEKRDEKVIAQMKATIWAYEFRKIGKAFENATGETLRPGMKILLQANVSFHELYGLSITIRDIDPAYTLGEMALRKREVIARLAKEELLERNKLLPLPIVPQRVAVISSPTAAGYGDFFDQLDRNPHGYRFAHTLFPSLMQGGEAEASIVAALCRVREQASSFDVAVIIRGGGSVVDLHCFDSYAVTREIALFPLPVITGIGHEKDDTVADLVAHTRMKTPTAVAEFLISGMRSFDERVLGLSLRAQTCVDQRLRDHRLRLDTAARGLAALPLRIAAEHGHRLSLLRQDLESRLRHFLAAEENRFRVVEAIVKHLDPETVLRRGYSITRHRGEVVRDPAALRKWAVIETVLEHGVLTSIVQERKEERERAKRENADLLPGFE